MTSLAPAGIGTGTAVRVAALAEIPPGEGRAYVVPSAAGQVQVAVFHHRDGHLSAVDAVCPHAGGPLADGQIDACTLICPLHLNTWDLRTGESTSGLPPSSALRVHAVEVDDDGGVVVTPAP